MERIPLYKVHMPKAVAKPLLKTLFCGYVTEGPRVAEFEKAFAQWVGNPHTLATNSCTSSLHIALHECGVKQGTNVVTTPMTCVATNTPIRNLGGAIKWADVEQDTGNISAASVEEKIDDDTRAVMVVHWAGMPCDLDGVHKACRKHGIPVVEDAAHALGATYGGKKIGSHSQFACFSFQAIKHISTIDGGALCCGDAKKEEDGRRLRWFGLDRNEPRDSINGFKLMAPDAGYKMNMNDVAATIGLVQLKYLDGIVAKHKRNAAFLRSELDGAVELPRVPAASDPAYWLFTILLPPSQRRKVSDHLSACGIDNSTSHMRNDIYAPLGGKAVGCEGLEYFSSRMLNIPCGWWLSQGDLRRIVKAVKEAVK